MYNLKNIRKLANEKKITIVEIANYCGITRQSYSKSIDRNAMSLETLDKTCEFFKIPMNELIAQTINGVDTTKEIV